jgi:mannose-6-phosphate isomerase-like protein (cupin superfamily)
MSLKTADVAGALLFVAEHTMPPMFTGPPPHIHDEMDHCFYILEGSVRFVVRGEELSAIPGSFVHIPRGVPHAFGNPAESPNRFLEINTPAGFERYYRELAEACPPGSSLLPARMYEIQKRYDTRPA